MRILLAALLLFPQILKALETKTPEEIKNQKQAFYAFVPYLNYDTTQSWSFGTAIEKESETKSIDTYLVDLEATPKARIRLKTKYNTHLDSQWRASLRTDFTNFYDPFYGFGMSTKVEDLKKIKQRTISSQLNFSYEHSPTLSFGPFIEFNQRIERPDYQIDKQRFFPKDRKSVV